MVGFGRSSARETTGRVEAHTRLLTWLLLLIAAACSQHDSDRSPVGQTSSALTESPGYPWTFRWVSITPGFSGSNVVDVHFDLSGAIFSEQVPEVYECNAPNQRPCLNQLVRIPEDFDFGILTILGPNNVRQGLLPPTLPPALDMRMTVRGPGSPIVDFHVDLPTGVITTKAVSGEIHELTDSCVTTTSAWQYCWKFELPCKAGEATAPCTAISSNCPDALARGTAVCTNALPEACTNLSCGLDWDLVEADATTQPQTRDLNGFKLNPRWGWQQFDASLPKAYDGKTSQPTEIDEPPQRPFGIWPGTCGAGVLGEEATGHHINWEPVAYQGVIFWAGHDWPDDDYNFRMQSPMSHGFPSGVTFDNGTIFDHDPALKQKSIKLEFKMGEVVDLMSPPVSPFWIRFASDEEVNDPNPQQINGPDGHTGTEAMTIGLMGMDTQHGAQSEVHPVWALAVHTNTSLNADQWDFFARNYGNEGWCSRKQHYLHNNGQPFEISFPVPRPSGATVAVPTLSTNLFATNSDEPAPTLSIPSNASGAISFHLPSPAIDGELGQFWHGSLVMNWTNQPPPPPPAAKVIAPQAVQSLGAPLTTVPTAALEDEEEEEGSDGEPERQIEELLLTLTPEQRATFDAILPDLHPHTERPQLVEVAAELTDTPLSQPPRTPQIATVEDEVQAARQFEIAKAFCGALNGQLPEGLGSCAEIPPTTLLETEGGSTGQNGWIVSPLSISLGAIDSAGSGIAFTEYSFDGTTYNEYSGPFVAPEGHVTVLYRSQDNLGNLEGLQQRSFDIDTRAPSSSASASVQGDHVALSYSVTDPTPGSGVWGLYSTYQSSAGEPVTLFSSGAQGTTTLDTQCTNVEYWGIDYAGNEEAPHQRLVDDIPPTLSVSPTSFCMVPPNHQRVRFRLGTDFAATATDTCDPKPSIEIVAVTSNEPDNGQGDGDTAGDVAFSPSSFCVRRERAGSGGGRVYTVTVEATDSSGNTARKPIEVRVPHSGSQKDCPGAGVEIAETAACQ